MFEPLTKGIHHAKLIKTDNPRLGDNRPQQQIMRLPLIPLLCAIFISLIGKQMHIVIDKKLDQHGDRVELIQRDYDWRVNTMIAGFALGNTYTSPVDAYEAFEAIPIGEYAS